MKDPLAGKYQTKYQREFDIAKGLVDVIGGELEWGVHNYQAFTYEGYGVRLVFYPHRTTAQNYHIRVRDEGSEHKRLAEAVMIAFDLAGGNNCTFSRHAILYRKYGG